MKTFRVLYCTLIVALAASALWAADLQTDEDDGSLFVNMPVPLDVTDNLVITADQLPASGNLVFHLYDDGGKEGDYSIGDEENEGSSGILEVTVPSGYMLAVSGTSITENIRYDYLNIYDGLASNGSSLLEYGGNEYDDGEEFEVGPFVSSGESMSFLFFSDGSNTYEGLFLTVVVFNPSEERTVTVDPGVTGGSVTGTESAVYGERVVLQVTPNEGYAYSGIEIVDEYGNRYESWSSTTGSEIEVQFDMPYSNVTVTPQFSVPHSITLVPAENGTLSSDMETAFVGSTVRLTADTEDGYSLKSVYVEVEGGQNFYANVGTGFYSNTASFTMPDGNVTLTPLFINPDVAHFDSEGCLDNGAYFHLECNGSVCTISQAPRYNPDENVTDFRCWYTPYKNLGLVCNGEIDEETGDCMGDMEEEEIPEGGLVTALNSRLSGEVTVQLGSPLDLGGFDAANNRCKMQNFQPIVFSGTGGVFDGLENTVNGFCFVSTNEDDDYPLSMGFMKNAKTIQDVTFDSAHVVVYNEDEGSTVGIVTDKMSQSGSAITNVHVDNSYVAGTMVGALAGNLLISSYASLPIGNSSVAHSTVRGLDVAATTGVSVSAAGGLVGYADGRESTLMLSQNTIESITVGDSSIYTGTGESYRGGFVGYLYEEYDIYATACNSVQIRNALARNVDVRGSGTAYVGGLAGSVTSGTALDSRLENIAVSGYIAGGIIGYIHDGAYGVFTANGDTLAGTNSITGTSVAGGILGTGNFITGGTPASLFNSFYNLSITANITGGNRAGGVAGYISNDNYIAMVAAYIRVWGNVSASAAVSPASYMGGLFGYVENGTELTIGAASFEGNVTFENTDASVVENPPAGSLLFLGPIFGYASVGVTNVYVTLSKGNLSYSGLPAANVSVGYIGGYVNIASATVQIAGNYRFGDDAVATGIGNVDAATWKAGGSAYFANARNTVTGLTDDGDVGYYYYNVTDNSAAQPTSEVYTDIFAPVVTEDGFSRVANGTVSETNMKSILFAAALNYGLTQSGEPALWKGKNNDLPDFSSQGRPSYLLPLVSDELASLDNDTRNAIGVKRMRTSVELTDLPNETTVMEGFVGYTDADGHPNEAFVNSLEAAVSALTTASTTPYLEVGSNSIGMITGNSVITDAVESIALKTKGLKEYAVEYQYCADADNIPEDCPALDEVTGVVFALLSPKVTTVSNDMDAYTTLVPMAFILDDPVTVLVADISFRDDANTAYDNISVSEFTTFSNVINSADESGSADDITKFVVKYYAGSFPTTVVRSPSDAEFNFHVYGYDASGEKTDPVTMAVASQTETFNTHYGAYFGASGFNVPIGYEYDSYSVKYILTETSQSCSQMNPSPTVMVEGGELPGYETLVGGIVECQSSSWTVSGLGKDGNDALDLKEVLLARKNWPHGLGLSIRDTFEVTPKYNAIDYEVTFDISSVSPEDGKIYAFGSGDAWMNSTKKTMNLDDGKDFLQLYRMGEGEDGKFFGPMEWSTSPDVESDDEKGFQLTENMLSMIAEQGQIPASFTAYAIDAPTAEFVSNIEIKAYNHNDEELTRYDQIHGSVVLSQTVGGKTFKQTSDYISLGDDEYDHLLYAPRGYDDALLYDVGVQPTVGYDMVVTGFEYPWYDDEGELVDEEDVPAGWGYDANAKTLKIQPRHMTGEEGDEMVLKVKYVPLDYNVTFNVESLQDEIVALGQGWYETNGAKTMNVETQKDFPKVYVYTEADNNCFNEAHWAGDLQGNSYEDFSTELLESMSDVSSGAVTLVPDPRWNPEGPCFVDYTYVRASIHDEENPNNSPAVSDYHGKVVLTQTWNGMTFRQEPQFGAGQAGAEQRLMIPADIDEILEYDVLTEPDPGYEMELVGDGFDYPVEGDWGYNATAKTLRIPPGNTAQMYVKYTTLHYNMSFGNVENLFVANKYDDVNGEYSPVWLHSASDVTIEDFKTGSARGLIAPRLYNAEGCHVGWKVDGVENAVGHPDFNDVFADMAPMVSAEDNSVNVLVPDLDEDHMDCDGERYRIGLEIEGDGSFKLVQKLGDEPQDENDPQQVVVEHEFAVLEGGVMEMYVPVTYAEDNPNQSLDFVTETGVTLTVVATPAPGYVVKEITYNTYQNGNDITVMVENGASLNIMQRQQWHVKFVNYDTAYVVYDLALGADDSSKVWIPADAVETGSLEIESDGTAAKMWTPYRTDKCFAGWTMVDPNGEQPEAEPPLYTEMDMTTAEFFSSNAAHPTKLYAKWVDYGEDCSRPATFSSLSLGYPDEEQKLVDMGEFDTLVVTQEFGNAVLKHRSRSFENEIAYNPAGYEVSVQVVPGPGYAFDESVAELMATVRHEVEGNLQNDPLEGDDMGYVVGDESESAVYYFGRPETATLYNFAYNVNAGDANVFYAGAPATSFSAKVTDETVARTFPVNIYRADACLAGWNFDAAATTGYSLLDETFIAAYDSASAVNPKSLSTLYAVWDSECQQTLLTVTSADVGKGELVLAQGENSFEVGSGLKVPYVEGGLAFVATFTPASGYKYNATQGLEAFSATGQSMGTLEDDAINVSENVVLKAVSLEASVITVVFAENAGNSTLFYEDDWSGEGAYAVGSEAEFPKGILRTDGVLLGWAMSRSSSKYYTYFNPRFMKDLQSYSDLGIVIDTLYAVWDTYGVFSNVSVTNANEKNGSFVISQTVNGVETEPIEVTAQGVQIPYSEKGLSFNVTFTTKAGYSLSSEEPVSSVEASSGTVLGTAANGGKIVFSSENNVALNAAIVADFYKFAYNVNGGDANVFYGDSWSSTGSKSLGDTSVAFPNNIYRSDACLEGWSTDMEADSGSAILTSEFIETLDGHKSVDTLYAVWKECEVETYKVSFANTNVGSLVLTQDVEDTSVSFSVADTGLAVPVVEGGLKFKAAYTLKPGYSVNADTLYVVDDIGGLLATLADNSLTVNDDITLMIPTEGDTFAIAFNVNRKGTVFYGADWVESKSYTLSDELTSIPLPAYVYTSDRCVVGWSLDSVGGEAYLQFNSDLADALQALKTKSGTYTMYAVWDKGEACDDAYDRISLEGKHGKVRLAEVLHGEDGDVALHDFVKDGTMLLPKTMNGNNLRVVSVPDSSYVLDSLVMTREGTDERQVFYEGDALVFNLNGGKFESFFGKANRTEVAFVNPRLIQSGNAVRFAFGTSGFEVTRKVAAHVRLETEDGDVIADETFIDSIVPPFNGAWDKFPLAAGSYVLTATIGDDRESDTFDTSFVIVSEIAAVSGEGWQMVSIGNLDKEAMVWDDNDAKFYWWDESSGSGDYWQYKEFSQKDKIVATRGYWYSSLEGRPLVLKTGVEKKIAEKVEWKLDSINSGWNLVANPYGFALNLYGDHPAENREPDEESGITFWRWNAEIADYDPAVTVGPYEAVWVKVNSSTDWTIPVAPDFASLEAEKGDTLNTMQKSHGRRFLAKANGRNDWTLQAVLTDARGHRDSWNILGTSSRPFVADEPPAGMGDHVNLSIVEGGRALAKSVKAPADEQEWTVSLQASSDRMGELSINGVSGLNSLGLKVFVTVDGKTSEVRDGEPVRVALTTGARKATVRVAKGARALADLHIDGLRSVQAGSSLNVSFNASASLAGTRTVVEVLNMDGKVVSSRSAKTLSGVNLLALDAPKSGLYMLRVRAGSQMKAGRIMVK